MSVLDDIKAKIDIVSYVQRTVPLNRAGRVYKACCPFHNERTPSFIVNPDTQSWRCFGACAEGGDLFSFAMKLNGWSFREALEELGRLAGVEVRQQTPEQREQDSANERLRGLIRMAADHFHERLLDASDRASRETLAYARDKRALSDETIARFRIGFAPPGWDTLVRALTSMGASENDLVLAGLARRSEEGRVYDAFRNRLMIPIFDERGRAVGFGARALAPEDNPKYLNSPQSPIFDKSRLLFGLHTAAAAIRDSQTVVIVEGYLDALQAQQAGYLNVVAQMGTALTETQLRLVAPRWASRVILALDSDAAGQNATRRSLEVARQALQADFSGKLGVEFRVITVPDAKDPDDLIRENPAAWQEVVAQAAPVADFVIGMELAALPANPSVLEREQAARRLMPLLVASEDDLYRGANLQLLAMRFRLSERDVRAWAEEQRLIARAQPPRSAQHPLQPSAPSAEPAPPVPRRQPAPIRTDPEAYCLNALFAYPDAYYLINRRLRELAADSQALAEGPLNALSVEDFTNTTYRQLMDSFISALAQDELDFVEYLRQHLDPALQGALKAILQEQTESFAAHLERRWSGDLAAVLKHSERTLATLDAHAELVDKALRLRLKRLERERQELVYLQGNEAAQTLAQQALLSIEAKRLIDAEIGKSAQIV
jgi:DNA primase